MKNFLVIILISLVLSSCSEEKKQEEGNVASDTTGVVTSSADTAKKESSVTEQKPEFDAVVKEVLTIMKEKKDMKELDKFLDQKIGYYVLFNANKVVMHDHGSTFADYGVKGGRSFEIIKKFRENLQKVNQREMEVKPLDVMEIQECILKERGVYKVLLTQPGAFLSGSYKEQQKVIGEKSDPSYVEKLMLLESSINTKVVLNVLEKGNPEVFYFGLDKNQNWCLLAIDLTYCNK